MSSQLKPGEIRFHQACPPPIAPGDYSVKVTQTLAGTGIDQTYETHGAFAVSGPRFFLKPTEVYSVYPPAGQFGPFDNALPHVVFTRRTLPWERSIDGRPQQADAPVPWLALLLLSRDDFADQQIPAVTARSVGELLDPGATVQGPKGLALESGQKREDLCNTIDLPAALFAEIAPSLQDLPLLTHVREVNTGGKETLSLKQDGWFTVVLGNRMPATAKGEKGETNVVCLVSLEGFGGMLPTLDEGRASVAFDAGKRQVRLAVLASWNFTCHGNNDFKTKMGALDDTSLLALPHAQLTGDAVGIAAVREAFTLGYAALNHTTRVGEKTVSWYRGPLVPLKMDPRSPYAAIPCADRALRYDPQSGLFAAEYAAAYELGRMMALQNRSFASAMYRYRKRVAQDLAAERHHEHLTSSLLGISNAANTASSQRTLEDAVASLLACMRT